ncbi:hypothetical protein ACFQ9X_51840 [Catenulispora yoronensis]
MSFSDYEGGGAAARRPERLTAEQVDGWEFARAGITHRGYDEESVLRFKRRVLAELQAAGQVESELRQRNDELAGQLRATYSVGDPTAPGALGPGAPALRADPVRRSRRAPRPPRRRSRRNSGSRRPR